MNQVIERVKKHIIEHKEAYIWSVIGVIVGGVTVYVWSQQGETVSINTNLGPVTKCKRQTINNNSRYQTISIYGNVIGRPGKPVFDTETGKRFASETLAAKAVGASPVTMSNHLKGRTDSVMGHRFKFAEDAA